VLVFEWALLGLNQRPLACESIQSVLAGVGLRWTALDDASLFSPLQTFLICLELVRDVPCCLEDGNKLGTDRTQPSGFIVELTMPGHNNIN
jgi:hypothetical protein